MLSPFFVVIYAIAVVVLLPLALNSLRQGSPPPPFAPFAKFYGAERYLNLTGDLFLVAVCSNAAAQLARHFDLIGEATMGWLEPVIMIPFGILLVAFLAQFIRAAIKVRRGSGTAA